MLHLISVPHRVSAQIRSASPGQTVRLRSSRAPAHNVPVWRADRRNAVRQLSCARHHGPTRNVKREQTTAHCRSSAARGHASVWRADRRNAVRQLSCARHHGPTRYVQRGQTAHCCSSAARGHASVWGALRRSVASGSRPSQSTSPLRRLLTRQVTRHCRRPSSPTTRLAQPQAMLTLLAPLSLSFLFSPTASLLTPLRLLPIGASRGSGEN